MVAVRWLDLVDPTREEVLAALPVHVDPDVVEVLAAHPGDGREPRPIIEGHGAYAYVESLDTAYAEIEELEDSIDTWPASRVRARISDLRHDLLHSRRTV